MDGDVTTAASLPALATTSLLMPSSLRMLLQKRFFSEPVRLRLCCTKRSCRDILCVPASASCSSCDALWRSILPIDGVFSGVGESLAAVDDDVDDDVEERGWRPLAEAERGCIEALSSLGTER